MINLDAKLRLATEEISEIVLNILLDHTTHRDRAADMTAEDAGSVGCGGDAAD